MVLGTKTLNGGCGVWHALQQYSGTAALGALPWVLIVTTQGRRQIQRHAFGAYAMYIEHVSIINGALQREVRT